MLQYYDKDNKCFIKTCFAHNSCYEKLVKSDKLPLNRLFQENINPIIDDMLSKGYGIQLSDLKDSLLEVTEGTKVHNSYLKKYIIDEYGKRVAFCQPYKKMNRSLCIHIL